MPVSGRSPVQPSSCPAARVWARAILVALAILVYSLGAAAAGSLDEPTSAGDSSGRCLAVADGRASRGAVTVDCLGTAASAQQLAGALRQAAPATTANVVADLTMNDTFAGDRNEPLHAERLDALLDALLDDSPRRHAALLALGERASCGHAARLLAWSGRTWTVRPNLRPSLLYLIVALAERCHQTTGSTFGDSLPDLMRRFGALLAEIPEAYDRLPAAWPFFVEGTEEATHRSTAVLAGLASLLARAHGVDHCGRGPRVGTFSSGCGRHRVHDALLEYVAILRAAQDERALAALRTRLLETLSDPELDAVIGDVADSIPSEERDAKPAGRRHPRRTIAGEPGRKKMTRAPAGSAPPVRDDAGY
jgi:hypothetical protein